MHVYRPSFAAAFVVGLGLAGTGACSGDSKGAQSGSAGTSTAITAGTGGQGAASGSGGAQEPLERPELLEQLEPLAALRAQEAPLLPRGAQAVVEARVVQGRALRAAGTWVARLRGLVEPQAEPVRAEEQTSREAAR
jgi:hypothetical protein